MQEEFLSGRENQVGNSVQMDFKGTLKERRMKYQDRREVQGQDSTRLIKRMREETGLEHEDPNNAKAAPVCCLHNYAMFLHTACALVHIQFAGFLAPGHCDG